MKLKCRLETVDMGDEIIYVPVGNEARDFHGIIKVNSGAQVIIDMLSEDIAVSEMIATLTEKYENGEEVLSLYVEKVITELRNAGFIEE